MSDREPFCSQSSSLSVREDITGPYLAWEALLGADHTIHALRQVLLFYTLLNCSSKTFLGHVSILLNQQNLIPRHRRYILARDTVCTWEWLTFNWSHILVRMGRRSKARERQTRGPCPKPHPHFTSPVVTGEESANYKLHGDRKRLVRDTASDLSLRFANR